MAAHAIEPTYRMGPSEDEKFYPSQLEKVMERVVNEFFADKTYDASQAEEWTHQLSERILAESRKLNMPRYKLISQVVIMQNDGQGVQVTSKSLWDCALDNWATCTFKSETLVCCAMLFGCYNE